MSQSLPRLFITADSRYRLWINGAIAARGPSRCWPQAQQVDEIDITELLHSGANTIAVQIYSPGYSHFAYLHRGVCGLLAWLEVDGITVCASDQTWRAARDASWREDGRPVSIYSSGVERRDMARMKRGRRSRPTGRRHVVLRLPRVHCGTLFSVMCRC